MSAETPEPLTDTQVDSMLAGQDLAPCMELPLADAKQLRDRCLSAGVPVALGRDDHCTTGCSPKVLLLARPEDVPRLGQLLREDWLDMLRAEGQTDDEALASIEAAMHGNAPVSSDAQPEGDNPPCPACGHAGPLKEECCADCGLALG